MNSLRQMCNVCCRLLPWEDSDCEDYAPYVQGPTLLMEAAEELSSICQQRQVQKIVDAVRNPEALGIKQDCNGPIMLLHISQSDVVPGQLSVKLLEDKFGFVGKPTVQQQKSATVLLINEPAMRLAAAVDEMFDLRQMQKGHFCTGATHFLIIQCGEKRLKAGLQPQHSPMSPASSQLHHLHSA